MGNNKEAKRRKGAHPTKMLKGPPKRVVKGICNPYFKSLEKELGKQRNVINPL